MSAVQNRDNRGLRNGDIDTSKRAWDKIAALVKGERQIGVRERGATMFVRPKTKAWVIERDGNGAEIKGSGQAKRRN